MIQFQNKKYFGFTNSQVDDIRKYIELKSVYQEYNQTLNERITNYIAQLDKQKEISKESVNLIFNLEAKVDAFEEKSLNDENRIFGLTKQLNKVKKRKRFFKFTSFVGVVAVGVLIIKN